MQRMKALAQEVEAAPDQQISLTDPDARSMATSGKGTRTVGYNVQTAVDAQHHLIVDHQVTNVGHDRSQLAVMAQRVRIALQVEQLEVVADRGYFSGEEIVACEAAGITAYVPRPQTSNNQAKGLFGKRDFLYVPETDTYRCPAGQSLIWRFTTIEKGMTLHCYWSSARIAHQRRQELRCSLLIDGCAPLAGSRRKPPIRSRWIHTCDSAAITVSGRSKKKPVPSSHRALL
jgi:hypothetical protein